MDKIELGASFDEFGNFVSDFSFKYRFLNPAIKKLAPKELFLKKPILFLPKS